jgi:hypothetical protein
MFGYIIIRKAEFPHFQKAHKIARELTEQRLDDILAGRLHLHKNPGKRKAVKPESPVIIGPSEDYPATGE